jgi:hypothetical protein
MAATGFGTTRPVASRRSPAGDRTAVRLLNVEPPLQPGPAESVGGPPAGTRADPAGGLIDAEREQRREHIRFVQQVRARRRRSRRRATRVL